MSENNLGAAALFNSMEGFAQQFDAWAGEEVQDDVAQQFARTLLPDSRAQLVVALMTGGEPVVQDAPDLAARRFAVELAGVMGPGMSQWFYRMAVLCTKLV
jgi:hypothetical protein